jgi:hypothetical protein
LLLPFSLLLPWPQQVQQGQCGPAAQQEMLLLAALLPGCSAAAAAAAEVFLQALLAEVSTCEEQD